MNVRSAVKDRNVNHGVEMENFIRARESHDWPNDCKIRVIYLFLQVSSGRLLLSFLFPTQYARFTH